MKITAEKTVPPGGLEIQFLGTGASDWPFSEYPVEMEKLTSGDFRGSSSIIVNRKILVDCGPSVLDAATMFKLDFAGLTDLLVTHTHADHFSRETLAGIARELSSPVNLFMEPGALERLEEVPPPFIPRLLQPGKEVDLGAAQVLPIPAGHSVSQSREQPLNFLFSNAGKHCFYGLDGAWMTREAWKALRNLKLGCIVWDAAAGEDPGDPRIFGHNNLAMIRIMSATLREVGVLSETTRVLLSHLAEAPYPSRGERAEIMAEERMEEAHDGMVVQLRP